MTTQVQVIPPLASSIASSGLAVTIASGTILGAIVVNPLTAPDQGLAELENLYVDIVNPAGLAGSGTTVELVPGQYYGLPSGGFSGDLSVNAVTAGHRFSAVIWVGVASPLTPTPGPFPPAGPTVLLQTIKAYLYQQYSDDQNLQAFVDAFNAMAQYYVDWFNETPLPIYTDPAITGPLLDWVGQGLYGLPRPTFQTVAQINIGPYDTFEYNQIPYNYSNLATGSPTIATSDDIYKRILTWHFFKGDGKVFNIEWLKRRILRFLLGANGSAPNIGETYPISVTFGPPNYCYINILNGVATITGGTIYNMPQYNEFPYDFIETSFTPYAAFALAKVFQEAVQSGVLELPFQFNFVVTIAGAT